MGSQQQQDPVPNYFTCTLGEAQVYNAGNPHVFQTINEFIEHQAHWNPDLPAVCFPANFDNASTVGNPVFNFKDLWRGSLLFAHKLESSLLVGRSGEKKCVALLCPSSVDFLFMWLGLMRCGCSVLLIAPQCTPAMIAHLCTSSNASCLFFADIYQDLALNAAGQSDAHILPKRIPWQETATSYLSRLKHAPLYFPYPKQSEDDIAYIFHTSGTSTGLPKPIPQTHHAGVGVLPCLDGSESATFTTTPLYHGGIADCFRAWTSKAMIWLFPAAIMPITSENVVQCLSTAEKISGQVEWIPSTVEYFSSVPYVLEMLSEDLAGLRWLQQMSLVGVGGASLPPKVGDKLFSQGVHLVSRYGSAECGFLLSSHRNYDTDKAWQYLRVPADSKYLKFEEQADDSGLFELIILKGWPYMAKTNRLTGDLATNDLFKPHPSIINAWKVDSRSDSQITLLTGKKFDPAPIEDNLASSSALIGDVLIFGNNRAMPGALIFPTKEAQKVTEEQLFNEVWRELEKLNVDGQDHTRIAQSMVVIMPEGTDPLAKSSKGTVLRGAAEDKHKDSIDSVYEDAENASSDTRKIVPNSEILPMIRKLVRQVQGGKKDLEDDSDFYYHGIDSAKATQIRSALQKEVGPLGKRLPWNVVYDNGNIGRLTQFFIDFRNGKAGVAKDDKTYMYDLVRGFSVSVFDDYSRLPIVPIGSKDHTSYNILLTGATGALGAHILDLLLACPAVTNIFCLVRASTAGEARTRVDEGLKKRRRAGLEQYSNRVHCFPSNLGQNKLGLEDADIELLRSQTNIIIHAAWNVNFSLSLESFVKDHIAGLTNLLRLSLRCGGPVRFLFCSSTASVLGSSHSKLIYENISANHSDADELGYSKSKWVAEAICKIYASKQTKGDTTAVLRIGQLTAHSETGVWNMTEAWPLMLSAGRRMKLLPDLEETLSWLPIDTAAEAIIQIAMPPESCIERGCAVYHLVNNSVETSWEDILHWLEPWGCAIVSPKRWLECLEELEDEPAKALLGLWKNAFGDQIEGPIARRSHEEQSFPPLKQNVRFCTDMAESIAEAMTHVGPIDGPQVLRMGLWLEEELRVIEEKRAKDKDIV